MEALLKYSPFSSLRFFLPRLPWHSTQASPCYCQSGGKDIWKASKIDFLLVLNNTLTVHSYTSPFDLHLFLLLCPGDLGARLICFMLSSQWCPLSHHYSRMLFFSPDVWSLFPFSFSSFFFLCLDNLDVLTLRWTSLFSADKSCSLDPFHFKKEIVKDWHLTCPRFWVC